MQKAITVRVFPMGGGFNVSELNEYLSQGYTVNNAYSSTDNALLVVLDAPSASGTPRDALRGIRTADSQ